MVFIKATCLLIVSVLSLSAAEDCMWNTTHCSCKEKVPEGSCFHRVDGVSPPRCNVDTCGAGGYKCDCQGTDFCKIDTCDTWGNAVDGALAPVVGSKDVPCKLVSNPRCLSKLGEMPEYKMVQVGEQSKETMFNMTWHKDVDNYIATKYESGSEINNLWPDRESLRLRHLNFRLYESDDGRKSFACVIINSWNHGNDGLGIYEADFTFESLAGHQIEFVQCDEKAECKSPKIGTTLTAGFRGSVGNSDGPCVTLPSDGSAVSVKTTNVQNIKGINFLGSDGVVDEYMFATRDAGLAGSVDSNGLVANGVVPEIIIKPAGILAQY